jgi:hypothetical protein
MSRDPALNRAHQKAFYERLKQDPVRWRAYLQSRAAYKRRVRSGAVVPQHVAASKGVWIVESIIRNLVGSDVLRGAKTLETDRRGTP